MWWRQMRWRANTVCLSGGPFITCIFEPCLQKLEASVPKYASQGKSFRNENPEDCFHWAFTEVKYILENLLSCQKEYSYWISSSEELPLCSWNIFSPADRINPEEEENCERLELSIHPEFVRFSRELWSSPRTPQGSATNFLPLVSGLRCDGQTVPAGKKSKLEAKLLTEKFGRSSFTPQGQQNMRRFCKALLGLLKMDFEWLTAVSVLLLFSFWSRISCTEKMICFFFTERYEYHWVCCVIAQHGTVIQSLRKMKGECVVEEIGWLCFAYRDVCLRWAD